MWYFFFYIFCKAQVHRFRCHNIKDNIKVGNIDDWTIQIINRWALKINNANKIIDKNANKFFICNYENLNKKTYELKKIFKFLSVSYNDKITQKIIDSNSFDKFKDNKFFRKGFSTNWKEELKKSTNKKILHTHGKLMRRYGYYE